MIEFEQIDDVIAREGEEFDKAALTLYSFGEVLEELRSEAKHRAYFVDAGREAYVDFADYVNIGEKDWGFSKEGWRLTKAYVLERMKEREVYDVSNYALEAMSAGLSRFEQKKSMQDVTVAEVDYLAHGLATFEERLREEHNAFYSGRPSVGSLVRVKEDSWRFEPFPTLGPGYVHEVKGGKASVRFPSNNYWDTVEVPIEKLDVVDFTGEKESLSNAKDELVESRSALAQYQAEMVNLARELGLDPDVSMGDPMYYGDMVSEALENLQAENALLKEQLSGKKAGTVPSRQSKTKYQTPESQEKKAREAAARPEGFDIKVGKAHWR